MRSCLLALVLLLLPASALAGVKETVATFAPRGSCLWSFQGQSAHRPERRQALRPGIRHRARDGVAGAGSSGRRLPLRGALLPRRQTVALYQGRRRSVPDLGGVAPLAIELVAKIGKSPITGIVLDASYYPPDLRIPGIGNDDTAYDALNSALGVNFNTITRSASAIRWSPRRSRADHPSRDRALPRERPPRRRRPHQSWPGPHGRPPVFRRTDRRVNPAGRRRCERRHLEGWRAQGPGADHCSPTVAQPLGDPRPTPARLEQLYRQPGLPGDRRP